MYTINTGDETGVVQSATAQITARAMAMSAIHGLGNSGEVWRRTGSARGTAVRLGCEVDGGGGNGGLAELRVREGSNAAPLKRGGKR
jgi:hypothetical protein